MTGAELQQYDAADFHTVRHKRVTLCSYISVKISLGGITVAFTPVESSCPPRPCALRIFSRAPSLTLSLATLHHNLHIGSGLDTHSERKHEPWRIKGKGRTPRIFSPARSPGRAPIDDLRVHPHDHSNTFHETHHPSQYLGQSPSNLSSSPLPISLLSTSKLVNAETAPIFAPKLDILRKEPMRLIVDSANISTFFAKHGHGLSGYNPSGYSFNFRQPSSTCIAITRHPLADLDDILSAVRRCIIVQSSWSELRKRVGFMLREAMTDEFDDPRSPNHPEGAKRGGLREDLTRRHVNAYPGVLVTRHVDDVREAEWEEVWGENTK
ncbi:hypothetical protein BDU57DRAFT_596145 [Ampelomyces quisqualis]|uniref:Uncharacterized protein n=1 Tax=Ampelomyces quisqualis TaxID=50730 RepID=A0A6A5QJ05_AMPQU|nr:hypothetical protein BDU57DRAFT_596145 [Ampelomyces quisqualis]